MSAQKSLFVPILICLQSFQKNMGVIAISTGSPIFLLLLKIRVYQCCKSWRERENDDEMLETHSPETPTFFLGALLPPHTEEG
jgi:hypothetical protein